MFPRWRESWASSSTSRSTTSTRSSWPPRSGATSPRRRRHRLPEVPFARNAMRTEGDRFLARAKDINRWTAGRLRLGDPQRYRVMDLDPDAGALSLEQLCRSAIRALAIELNGDPGFVRAGGVAQHRVCRCRAETVGASARPGRRQRDAEVEVEHPGYTADSRSVPLRGVAAGHAVRGLGRRHREMAQPARTPGHARRSPIRRSSMRPTTTGNAAEPAAEPYPGQPEHPYYVHEVLAGWDGWSLSAPRPGKHDHPQRRGTADAGTERLSRWTGGTADAGSVGTVDGQAEVTARAALWTQVLIPDRGRRSGGQQCPDGRRRRGPRRGR